LKKSEDIKWTILAPCLDRRGAEIAPVANLQMLQYLKIFLYRTHIKLFFLSIRVIFLTQHQVGELLLYLFKMTTKHIILKTKQLHIKQSSPKIHAYHFVKSTA